MTDKAEKPGSVTGSSPTGQDNAQPGVPAVLDRGPTQRNHRPGTKSKRVRLGLLAGVLVLGAIVTLSVLLGGGTSPVTGTSNSTHVHYLQLFSPGGVLLRGLQVGADFTGRAVCQPTLQTADPRALRCFTSNRTGQNIWDPCYSAPDQNKVACMSTPFDTRITEIDSPTLQLTGLAASCVLRCPSLFSFGQPWVIAIRDPTRSGHLLTCYWESSATGSYVSKTFKGRYNWGCSRGPAGGASNPFAGFAVGDLARPAHHAWTIHFNPGSDTTASKQVFVVEVTEAWY